MLRLETGAIGVRTKPFLFFITAPRIFTSRWHFRFFHFTIGYPEAEDWEEEGFCFSLSALSTCLYGNKKRNLIDRSLLEINYAQGGHWIAPGKWIVEVLFIKLNNKL